MIKRAMCVENLLLHFFHWVSQSWWFIWVLQHTTSKGMPGLQPYLDASTWACKLITFGPNRTSATVFKCCCLTAGFSGCIGSFLSKAVAKRWKPYPCDEFSDGTRHLVFAQLSLVFDTVRTTALKLEVLSSLCLSYMILIVLNNLTRQWEMETWHLLFRKMKDFML